MKNPDTGAEESARDGSVRLIQEIQTLAQMNRPDLNKVGAIALIIDQAKALQGALAWNVQLEFIDKFRLFPPEAQQCIAKYLVHFAERPNSDTFTMLEMAAEKIFQHLNPGEYEDAPQDPFDREQFDALCIGIIAKATTLEPDDHRAVLKVMQRGLDRSLGLQRPVTSAIKSFVTAELARLPEPSLSARR